MVQTKVLNIRNKSNLKDESMNQIIIDVSYMCDAKKGAEVVLIGNRGDQEIKLSAFSDISDQLNYEVLAHFSESIKRIVI